MIQPLFKETNNNGPTTVYKHQRPYSTSVIYRDGGVFVRPLYTGGHGWEHSDLDATRRLEELQSEFAEAPPIFISSSPPLRIEAHCACTVYYFLIGDFKGMA